MAKYVLTVLTTAYPFPPATLEAAQPLRDYAAAALTTVAFTAHTNFTLTEEGVMVRPLLTMTPVPPEPLHRYSNARPPSTPGVKAGTAGAKRHLHQTLSDT